MNITSNDRKKYPSHTDDAIIGIKTIKKFGSSTLMDAIQNETSFKNFRKHFPSSFNPTWIKARILDTLYDRDVLSDMEYSAMRQLYC